MTDQQLITEYPTVDDHADDDLDDDPSGELTRFDLTDDSNNIDRARDEQATITRLDTGTFSVTFADGDHDPVDDLGDGATDYRYYFVGDNGADNTYQPEFRVMPGSSGEVREITVNVDATIGSDYGPNVDVYLEQEGQPDGNHDGTLGVDELFGAPVVRCGSCGTIVWHGH